MRNYWQLRCVCGVITSNSEATVRLAPKGLAWMLLSHHFYQKGFSHRKDVFSFLQTGKVWSMSIDLIRSSPALQRKYCTALVTSYFSDDNYLYSSCPVKTVFKVGDLNCSLINKFSS